MHPGAELGRTGHPMHQPSAVSQTPCDDRLPTAVALDGNRDCLEQVRRVPEENAGYAKVRGVPDECGVSRMSGPGNLAELTGPVTIPAECMEELAARIEYPKLVRPGVGDRDRTTWQS